MKVEYRKLSIVIIPENDQDEVYLESVLGLKKKGDVATATRVAVIGLDLAWAYVEIKPVQQIPEKRIAKYFSERELKKILDGE